MSLPEKVDRLHEIRQLRLQMQRETDEVRKAERRIEEEIMEALHNDDGYGVVGKNYTATLNEKEVPVVDDWEAFGAWVLERGDLSVLQRRLSMTAIREILDEDEKVPGLGKIINKSVSLTKTR